MIYCTDTWFLPSRVLTETISNHLYRPPERRPKMATVTFWFSCFTLISGKMVGFFFCKGCWANFGVSNRIEINVYFHYYYFCSPFFPLLNILIYIYFKIRQLSLKNLKLLPSIIGFSLL